MNTRIISPRKRSNSSYYQFRMVVPPRYRQRLGQTEILQSLRTSNIGEARRMCAALQDQWLKRFAALENELNEEAERNGTEIVDRFLDREAEAKGGLDKVVAYELDGLSLAESAYLEAITSEDVNVQTNGPPFVTAEEPYPQYREPLQRSTIGARRRALEGSAHTCSLPGVEAAARALSLSFWDIAGSFLEEAFAEAGMKVETNDRVFAVAAEHYLRRLLDHPLAELEPLRAALPLPEGLKPRTDAFPMIASAPPSNVQPASPMPPPPKADGSGRSRLFPVEAGARTIFQVFEAWAADQPLESRKLIDEWRVAIRRFTELFGDVDVADIDSDMVLDFREAMRRLPSRPKRAIAALPLLKQIELAKTENLRTLSGPTVAKLLSGLRVTLGFACDPLRIIRHNPAKGVSVDDAKSELDARLAFSPDELAQIFTHPLMIDPDHKGPLDEFWLQLLAPLSGLRLEEMGKLRPHNILCEGDIWYIAVERDRARKRRAAAAAGEAGKTVKSKAGYRHVPIHWLLLEAGFLDFVRRASSSGAEWLFSSLEPDEYGNRTKNVSRRLIRRFRSIGIIDEEKVFYSFRHSMKRACRNTSMKEEIADLLAGHAPASVGRKYGAGAALDVLQEAVNMIEYNTIAWDPVIATARARLERVGKTSG